MNVIEIFAVIFSVIVLLKVLLSVFRPKLCISMGNSFVGVHNFMQFVYLALAAVVGYYLLEDLGIVNVGAVMLFCFLLLGSAVMPYWDHVMKLRKRLLTQRNRMWLAVTVWTALSLWILYVVFV